jgi:hypothetical protein
LEKLLEARAFVITAHLHAKGLLVVDPMASIVGSPFRRVELMVNTGVFRAIL